MRGLACFGGGTGLVRLSRLCPCQD